MKIGERKREGGEREKRLSAIGGILLVGFGISVWEEVLDLGYLLRNKLCPEVK